MGGTNNESNIEVNLDLIIDGVRLKIEKEKISITGGTVHVEEDVKTGWRSLQADGARQGGMALGGTLMLAGVTLLSTHVVWKWLSVVYILLGLILMWWFMTSGYPLNLLLKRQKGN